ncbi:MAG: transcriptional regulator, TetR family [Xanthobacteraceae bacterium]|nr:transcriptional regulator, TetR family [Xanthobacteraceae bacterium]
MLRVYSYSHQLCFRVHNAQGNDRTPVREDTLRVTKQKVAEHHRSILASASRLFRERGFNDVGVAEIMQASGLTHGAFYGHFRSKADLAGQACRQACTEGLARWQKAASLSAIVGRYLSPSHRDDPATGCGLSALAAEAARQAPELQKNYAEGLSGFIDAVEQRLDEADPLARRRQAIAVLASMIGALTMARGVAAGDPELSDEILQSVRAELDARFGD